MGAVTGQYTTQAIVGGFPAVAYYDVTNTTLKYVRANDALGTSWGPSVEVDLSGNNVGEYASMTVVNGRPAISYYDNSFNSLKYVRANDAAGTTWGSPNVIDAGGDLGLYTSLALINGKPAIAYYDVTNTSLKYINSNDINGQGWQGATTVDNLGDVGKYASLTAVNGFPAICYYGTTNTNLLYIRANDANGDTWGAQQVIDDAGSVGTFCNMKVVDGNPAISYCSFTGSDLKYIRSLDINGIYWGTSVLIDGSTMGEFNSLAVIKGHPAISYLKIPGDNLQYVRADDSTGTAWGPIQVLATAGLVGKYSDLLETSTSAGICYIDETKLWPMYIGGSTTCMPALVATAPFGCTSYTSPSGLYTYTQDGFYYDTLTTVNGCDSIFYMDVSIGFNISIALGVDEITSIFPGDSYQWLDCNNGYAAIAGAIGETFFPTVDGAYAVAVTQFGCLDTSSCLQINLVYVGLNQTDGEQLTLYPNPNNGLFAIDLSEQSEMIVTDALGKTMRKEQLKMGKNEINFAEQPQGIYFVSIRNNNAQKVLKMIVNE
jgi:hypothetical protein